MSGYLRSQRDRFAHPLFRAQKFCRGYAWDWMCAQAAFKDHEIDVAGKTISLNRGQFTASIRFMAGVWGWDKGAVSRFITRLKTEAMIETATDTGQLIISICNYETYQAGDDNTETATETATGTAARQQRDNIERRVKKVNINNGQQLPSTDLFKASFERPRPDPIEEGFKEFWEDVWPTHSRKKQKVDCAKVYRAACLGKHPKAAKIEPGDLNNAARAYLETVKDMQFLKGTLPWLREPGWEPFIGDDGRVAPVKNKYQEIAAKYQRMP